ncbi:hypothetical protein HY732_00755 [Candidatus Uhrbacteria bacterium]|nr:hypothetical protein [Candidatus Uhrbacteria bacterium]
MEPGKLDEIKWVPLDEIDESGLSHASSVDFGAYKKRYGFAPPKKLKLIS